MDLTGREISHYHVLEPLGEGGMAVVYKAYDTHLDRTVALKVIRVSAFPADGLMPIHQRFEREAKALARLSHPNIVGVIDFGEYEGAPYLVMEFLPGGSLKDRLNQPLPWQQAVRLLIPVARALGYAHTQNIIHRDVKPSNILITQSGEPMLTDFGIAKILDLGPGQSLTSTGVGIGTPEYMAPEQGMGNEVDVRADVYALGVVFYEMVAGRRPYEADTPIAVVFKHIMDPLPRPSDFILDLPPEVEQVLIKALAKQPDERFQSMEAFASALERLTNLAPVNRPPIRPPMPALAVRSGPPPTPPAVRPPPAGRQAAPPATPQPSPPAGQGVQLPVKQHSSERPASPAGIPPAQIFPSGPLPGRSQMPPPPPGFHGAVGLPLPPLKKQFPAWLAVILTLVILGTISLSCYCMLQWLLQGIGSI